MKFDLIKYNTSQDTSHPIRNKWFRFYKHDMSNEPKLPKEYMSWDSVKRGHAWKKTGKWDPTRLKELRTQVEEWYEFINRDENLSLYMDFGDVIITCGEERLLVN